MPDASSDAKLIAIDGKALKRFHPVDVNEMGGPRQSEGHDGHQTLATCQDPPIKRRNFSQKRHRLVYRPWCMISEGRSLHLSPASLRDTSG